jgi:hypothetical protein
MRPGDPPAAEAECEPEETIETLAFDKTWAASVVSRAGVAAPAPRIASSSQELKTSSIPMPFRLFVKPQ